MKRENANDRKRKNLLSAFSTKSAAKTWSTIDWVKAERMVFRLQVRITKAIKEGKHNKAKALGWILTHSKSAKLLAIKKVTEAQGSKTAGIDGECWNTATRKYKAVEELSRKGYSAQPLRTVMLAKKQGGVRKLGIPTIRDRAMQALYAMALEPWAECQGDPNSYGFRRERGCLDAQAQIYIILAWFKLTEQSAVTLAVF